MDPGAKVRALKREGSGIVVEGVNVLVELVGPLYLLDCTKGLTPKQVATVAELSLNSLKFPFVVRAPSPSRIIQTDVRPGLL